MTAAAPSDRRVRTRARTALLVVAALLASLLTIAAPSPAVAEEEVLAFPSPEDFVVQQYLDFLAREPDDAGLEFWAELLRSGESPTRLVEVMVDSPEFGQVVAPLVRLYRAYFERSPDLVGLQFWASVLRTGASLDAVSLAFAESDEFQATYGSLSDRNFVALVYRNVLFREADKAGLDYWTAQLAGGLSRGAVMTQFSESVENVRASDGTVKATMLYLGMLRREPEDVGLAYWAAQIDSGLPYRDAIGGFIVSTEYSRRIIAIFDETHPLTGEAARSVADRPALVVKIDNHNGARPQIGLNQADIVWEELVEGNITRFAAAYHRTAINTVGPVRSARTGDLDLIAQLDRPLFAASGANAAVLAAIGGAPVVNVNAIEIGSAYFRASGRRAPHNLMGQPRELWASDQASNGGRPPQLLRYREVGEAAAGQVRQGVDIDWGNTDVSYRWNGVGWVRTQDGRLHVDSAGRAIAPPNVIVQVTTYTPSPADARSPEAQTVGSGVAYLFTGGRMIEGTWSRGSANDRIVYRDGKGREVELTPGRTWVALAKAEFITLR